MKKYNIELDICQINAIIGIIEKELEYNYDFTLDFISEILKQHIKKYHLMHKKLGAKGFNYLNKSVYDDVYIIDSKENKLEYKTKFTKSDIEEIKLHLGKEYVEDNFIPEEIKGNGEKF